MDNIVILWTNKVIELTLVNYYILTLDKCFSASVFGSLLDRLYFSAEMKAGSPVFSFEPIILRRHI